MLSFDTDLSNALKNSNTTAFWVLKLYYNDESAFIGVSDRHRQDGTDIYYGIVASWGVYRQSLDFFNFTTSIGNMNVVLINSDNSIKGGRFTDLLSTNNFANRKWELFLNTNETSTLDTAARMIASGVISGEIDFDRNSVTLNLLDYTTRYDKQIPRATVDSSTYTNAPFNNIGKPIPMSFGDFYEKTDIGTIATSHFDRYYQFYKSAFPAIITDEWDVQEQGSEAKADNQALHTMDNENIYIYKNGLYPTLTGTVDVTGNPEIEYKGSTGSLYAPLSTSNLASASGSGSFAVSNATRVSDGSFSNYADWAANSGTTNNSIATMTYAVPKINKVGNYSAISALVKWGTNSDFEGENGETFRYTANSANVDHDSITDDSETKTNIGNLYSGKTATWDFEGSIEYSLRGGSDNSNHSAQIYETGVVVDFTFEDIEPHEIEELYETYWFGGRKYNYDLNDWQVIVNTKLATRTAIALTPSKLDYVYYSGKGRKYGAYIDADSRNNGYNKGDLLENPIYIIESILRSELGEYYSSAATSTTSNKLVDSGASFATSIVGQTVYNVTDGTSAMVTARDSGTTLSIDADIMASGESYIISGLTSDEIDYASFDTSGNTSNGLLANIYEDAVADVKLAFCQNRLIARLARLCFSYVFISGNGKFKIKTLQSVGDYTSADQTINFDDINLNKVSQKSLGLIKNEIVVKYNHDYGAKQNLSEVSSSDSTSQGTTVSWFNQTARYEIQANEILDTTTATKMATAYKGLMKDRHNKLSFSTNSPKYNHLEIGDIINFTNFTVPKIYGTAVNDGDTNKYYIISDISKSITSANIECIQVGDVDV